MALSEITTPQTEQYFAVILEKGLPAFEAAGIEIQADGMTGNDYIAFLQGGGYIWAEDRHADREGSISLADVHNVVRALGKSTHEGLENGTVSTETCVRILEFMFEVTTD